MTASDVIELARAEGVELVLSSKGDLILPRPRVLASQALRDVIRAHKEELLALLASRGPPAAASTEARVSPTAAGTPAPQRRTAWQRPNTTPTPDEFFDAIAPTLGEGELRVMLYLIRRTFGFNRDRDRVSLSQFCEGIVRADGRRLDHGTGMQHRHVTAALVSLEEKGLVRKLGGGRGRGKAPTYVLPIAEESGEGP